jgi:shikimate kinase
MLLFLTGMPGSGKTYWMQQLGAALQFRDTVDLDAFMEQENKMTIPELFARGELYFRQQEQAALKQVIAAYKNNTIVSTGGGLPSYPGNMELMKASGPVVYLSSSISRLAERVRQAPDKRPLLISSTKEELEKKLAGLLEQRTFFYEQADIKIEVDNISLATFAAQIRKYIL